ncbi:MAG TPA: hypothetical protein VGA31_15010 [Thermoanaerobaculia bacterium]
MITNRKTRLVRSFALVAALSSLAAAPRPTPSPTPQLSGGFGKAPVSGRARRDGDKKGIRITNDSLVTDPGKGKLTTSRIQATPTPRAKEASGKRPANANATPAVASEPEGAGPPEGAEAYWRGEARRLRGRVAEIKEAIARLEAESRKLESDFYSWDDGAYRDRVIKPAWDKAREDFATAKKDLPVAEKELEDLPDRARRAGALPGWLRE